MVRACPSSYRRISSAALTPVAAYDHFPTLEFIMSVPSPASSRPMTPREAAAFLGLDVKTITRWARLGYLPAHPLGEGKRKFWRFLLEELKEWLAAKTNRRGDES